MDLSAINYIKYFILSFKKKADIKLLNHETKQFKKNIITKIENFEKKQY
ncbi:hypothetical protein Abm4_0860 [Methanobrevibacter sp. AbM4]|nr:hypothetical protein Abm4_0860 [Methanobrevibacter sp. AbM4]